MHLVCSTFFFIIASSCLWTYYNILSYLGFICWTFLNLAQVRTWENRWCIFKYSFVFAVTAMIIPKVQPISYLSLFWAQYQRLRVMRNTAFHPAAHPCLTSSPQVQRRSHRCRYSRPAGTFSLSSLSHCLHYTVWLLTYFYFLNVFWVKTHRVLHCWTNRITTHHFSSSQSSHARALKAG